MKIYKVATYGKDSNGNIGGQRETYFADSAKAMKFAKSEGRTNGGDAISNRHFWGEPQPNTFASFAIDNSEGEKVTQHAEVSFHELL